MSIKVLYPLVICLASQANPVNADNDVVIAFGNTIPPWVMEGGKSGILIDLAKDCLEPDGYAVKPLILPYTRRLAEYSNGRAEVVTDINSEIIEEYALEGYFTGYFYAYKNTVYSLAENNLSIKKISDLKDYSLVSWQGAKFTLGDEYAEMARNNSKYVEIHDQKAQVRLLYKKRADFIQMDSKIFDYYQEALFNSSDINRDIKIDRNQLLGKNRNGFLFKSKELRDRCLKNIETIMQSKKYQNILYFDN